MVLNVVIMAAGKGTRMRSARPKVLHRLAGRHLLQHVLDAAAGLGASRTIVVTGHGAAEVEQAIGAPGLAFVRQEPQLGTGHALQQAAPLLDDAGTTLVLNGDVPLIEVDTLQALIAASGGSKLALLTVVLADPTGYGRVLRSGGAITAIVEDKDASADQREIAEIYTGVMAAPTAALKRWLAALKNDNAAGEYYLTDVVGLAVAGGTRGGRRRRLGRDRGARHQQRGAARRPRAALPAAGRRAADERGRAPRRPGALRPARHACAAAATSRSTSAASSKARSSSATACASARTALIRNARIAAGALIRPYTHIDGEALGASVGEGAMRRPVRPPARRRGARRRGAHRQLRRGQELDPGARRQGQPPRLPRRRRRRRAGQLRRRRDHRQLRRREQAPHHDRRRCARRQQLSSWWRR